jgi:putative transposase
MKRERAPLTASTAERPSARGSQRSRAPQLALPFANTWGGRRAGAGRKPGRRPATPHRARPPQRAAEPVHVTLRARLAPLRSQHVFPTVRLALRSAARRDPARFRIVAFSVQRDHVHLLVEASDRRALSSGMRSVTIRVARYVNDLLSRRGALWACRWHGRALGTPAEVRSALVYVLGNFRKHARQTPRPGVDPYSSGVGFDGWRGHDRAKGPPPIVGGRALWRRFERAGPGVVLAPRTWLAARGWRRHGLLGLGEAPGGDAPGATTP